MAPRAPQAVGRGRSDVFRRPRLAAAIRKECVRLGKQVRALREERGLSQMGLAELAGLHLNSLHKLETGAASNPTLGTLIALATALDVDVRELLPAQET